MKKLLATLLLLTVLVAAPSFAFAGGQSTAKSFTLTINPAPPAPLVITTTSPLVNGQETVAYSVTFTVTGGVAPYTWSVTAGALPPGLSLSPTGVLSGTPSVQGVYNFTITATDSQSNVVSGSVRVR
jgi:hypothetical protein